MFPFICEKDFISFSVILYFQLSNLLDQIIDCLFSQSITSLEILILMFVSFIVLEFVTRLKRIRKHLFSANMLVATTKIRLRSLSYIQLQWRLPLPSFDTFYYIILFCGFRPCLGTGVP